MPNSFKRNLIIGIGFSLFLLIASSVASFISITNLLSSAKRVEHTHHVILELESVNTLLLEAESGQRGFLLTDNPEFLQPLQTNNIAIRDKTADIRKLTSDNAFQQRNVKELIGILEGRLALLNQGIVLKQQGKPVTPAFLSRGYNLMLQARAILDRMEGEEHRLLIERTQKLQRLSAYTPVFIVLAGIISFITIFVFYGRIVSDFKQRSRLQNDLVKKDEQMGERLSIVKDIADKISQGNYSIRVRDESQDALGSLSGSLNKMAESLEYSFELLSDKDWLQTGLAGLNERMLGEQHAETLANSILGFITGYTQSIVGALYLANESGRLMLTSGFALSANARKEIELGEGIAGQCALDRKIIRAEDIRSEYFTINLAAGELLPSSVIASPLLHNGHLIGVIELGSVSGYTRNHHLFLDAASGQVAIAINTSQATTKLEEMVEETQLQSEELQVQQAELENINEELRMQSQKLQVSEEELKTQHQELMQINTELEERTTMLEDKNQLIQARNLEIQEKARELEITTRYKSDFLANMSHELRTPLNSILLLSRLMLENREGNLTSEQVESSAVIHTSGKGLLHMIDEILDLSKIESGKMEIEYQTISVKEITNDLRSMFAPLATEKNIEFAIDISAQSPEQIETDKMRLNQVLANLISNAIKFTANGSVKLTVHPDANSPMLVFAVRDTGIGIPVNKQQLVFEAFQQADGSTRRQYGGTGLGLSISRELARLLGGRIELSSEPGRGSEFCLFLPVTAPRRGHAKPEPLFAEVLDTDAYAMPPKMFMASTTRSEKVLVTQDNTADKMNTVFQRIDNMLKKEAGKVLIVEENATHAQALAYFLENFYINAKIETNVRDGIRSLLAEDRACVILDAGINNGNIHQTIKQVKATPGLEEVPVIVFTGKSLSRVEEARLKQHVNSIVIKTAHSYQRILDEVSLYLHLVEKQSEPHGPSVRKLGKLTEVLQHKKVMIADDDVRNIFSLSKALESFGMEIISAMDGKEALQQLLDNPAIDIILLDMMMPEMDGYETLKQIRAIPRFAKLPIIAVTAKAMAGDREKCISSGASDYITKPVDRDQLLSLLRVWLYDHAAN